MAKTKKIEVENKLVSIINHNNDDYISLSDMAKYRDAERSDYIIQNWMRTRSTIEFIGLWEKLYNPNFKSIEFDGFRTQAGLNSFALTPSRWIEQTDAIGMISKRGRYGGTFAHKDIAFEFGSWLSPTFKLYLIKEYQRLKEIETNQYNLEWNVKRILSKANYHIQTDAIKDYILPNIDYDKDQEWLVYAEEADLLNVVLFRTTAKDWRTANPELAKKGLNIRDFASINELAVLSNIESINAEMIRERIQIGMRYSKLKEVVAYQLEILDQKDFIKSVKKLNEETYPNEQKKLADGN